MLMLCCYLSGEERARNGAVRIGEPPAKRLGSLRSQPDRRGSLCRCKHLQLSQTGLYFHRQPPSGAATDIPRSYDHGYIKIRSVVYSSVVLIRMWIKSFTLVLCSVASGTVPGSNRREID